MPNPSPPAAPMPEELWVEIQHRASFPLIAQNLLDVRRCEEDRDELIREVERLRSEAARAKADLPGLLEQANRQGQIDFQADGIELICGVMLKALSKVPTDGPGSFYRREILPVIQQMQKHAKELRKSQPPDAGAEGPESKPCGRCGGHVEHPNFDDWCDACLTASC